MLCKKNYKSRNRPLWERGKPEINKIKNRK